MQLTLLSPRKALNKAYLKVKPTRSEIALFKKNLIGLLDGLDETESEEHNKNDLGDFLKNTFYHPKFYINTKDRTDLVIHNGPDSKSFAGVLIEAKKPSNKTEMIRPDNLNAKAFHELILYYLRERITNHNLEIKHLVATNIYEWYVFDAGLFEKTFAQNKILVKQFTDFEEGRLAGKTTDFFYKEIAEPFMAGLTSEICFTMFDFREYDKPLRNDDKKDDAKLIALYKLLSPEHLLKLPFSNDSNSLDKAFYTELLHIIGLTETREGNKKLIGRKKEGQRDPGSLIENAIIQIDSRDIISRLDKPSRFGEKNQERLFNVSLELVITWINRILFLKLLEAQLITYHKGDPAYAFLNRGKVKGYDAMDSLFFRVLAKKTTERDPAVAKLFENVPYLNSSLFEPTELERETIFISNLQDESQIPVHSGTVLKNSIGKRLTGTLNGLNYLFEFLDAYDFSGEGAEEIQEDNKTLINASVLGLIFEKINGYRDGSFFTPGFITMYMCRETIRRAVVQKFNDRKGWNCQDLEGLYDKIEDKKEANEIINQLRICDPAVGSGHFLVSALNEIIAIKSELKILSDKDGKRLKEYHVEVVNDELIITDEDGKLFEYNPNSPESRRVQEALFREKQTIIENCLFGVDINPNSVKICGLRLWIELLKNAYYLTPQPPLPQGEGEWELETLPNIDINIKCGNSLISRYALDADIRQALKRSKWSIDSYRMAVMSYRNAENKEQKREMERLIAIIKNDFQVEMGQNDPKKKKLDKLLSELYHRFTGTFLFEPEAEYGNEKFKEKAKKEQQKLEDEITKLNKEIDEVKTNRIFENAFEWRFEFPEVLNDEGDFIGFDVVIGNPPYQGIEDISWDYRRFYESLYLTAIGRFDLYSLFIEKAMQIKLTSGVFTFIVPGKFLNNKQFIKARKIICENHGVIVVKIDEKVFDEAQVDSVIIENYADTKERYKAFKISSQELQSLSETDVASILQDKEIIFRLEINTNIDKLISKIETDTLRVKEIAEVRDGIVAGTIKDLLFLDNKLDKSSHKLYFGKHLSKYHLSDTNVWVNYKPDEMMKEEIKRKGNKRTGLWMRDKNIFEREKIIYRKVGKEIIATFAERGIYYEQTIHSCHIVDKKFDIMYVLGLFNSRLFKFYYQKTNSQGGDIFPQVRISSVENLPIKIADRKNQNDFVKIVDNIIETKSKDQQADTTALEKEIDRLVYELYGLTEEEITIVENL
ncbi:MAG: TaqI-like C-terminal specificity domain-containing protein [bacterium]